MTFDYRSFGLSAGEPRQVVSVRRQLADIRAAIAYLRSRPEVDPDRVALWGSSLGGGHVDHDRGRRCADRGCRRTGPVQRVSQGGRRQIDEGGLCTLSGPRSATAYAGGSADRPSMSRPSAARASVPSLRSAPMQTGTIEALTSGTWRNEVAPRGLLDMMAYKPGTSAPRVRAPLLVCIGEFDRESQGPLDGAARPRCTARRTPKLPVRTLRHLSP